MSTFDPKPIVLEDQTVKLMPMLPEHAEHFHEDFETRAITHLIDETVWLTPSILATPLAGEIGRAHV